MTALVMLGVSAGADPTPRVSSSPSDESVLKTHLLVTWYGNPNSPRMGVLGRCSGRERADGLRKQADAYEGLTTKRVMRALQCAGIKLFYEQDHDLFTPAQVTQMAPAPSVVIDQ